MKKIALALVILAIGATAALWVSDAIASSPRNASLKDTKYFIVTEAYSGEKNGYYSDDVKEDEISVIASGYFESNINGWRYFQDDLQLNRKDYKVIIVNRRY